MLNNQTITKKTLEAIVHETFVSFGILSSSFLLDSLKLLGFYYATNAGVSINIEDLKTPDIKTKFLENTSKETQIVSEKWRNGIISDNERFQFIIDSWNVVTESLKNRIVDYYQQFDPVNNLYIMAFSGARGNMSQVRQLVGMRGLMSDQEGKIIDLPIQTNFREGLSSIDYIISSYGARKGIVDTALKTADSGYLTRRLIYVAQDLVIREFNCNTTLGLLLLVKKKTSSQNFIGRSILSLKNSFYPYQPILQEEIDKKNSFLDSELFSIIQQKAPVILNLRSSLTCQSNGSICQMCYGWDLAHKKLISMGEVVGTLAAQSIGEPGTQLTMRTFHTGGIFTSETLKQVRTPFSGKIVFPDNFKAILFRTNHGMRVLKLQQELKVQLINWKGAETIISLDIGFFLYVEKSCFLQKGQLIAEYSTQTILPGPRKIKPIYTAFSGEIKFENIILKKKQDQKKRVTRKEGVVWISSGTLFSFPKETEFPYTSYLQESKSIGKLKIISPMSGFISFRQNKLSLQNKKEKKEINLFDFIPTKTLVNFTIRIVPLIKNFQYVDEETIICFIYFFPEIKKKSDFEKIITIREKLKNKNKGQFSQSYLEKIHRPNRIISEILFIQEKDTWSIQSDQIDQISFGKENDVFVRTGSIFNLTCIFGHSGFLLKKQGLKFLFQHALPIYLPPNTALYMTSGQFVEKNELLATLVKYTQQTEDIVQGLPKIEELIEARKAKNPCILAISPGILLYYYNVFIHHVKEDCLILLLNDIRTINKELLKEKLTTDYYIAHKFFSDLKLVLFESIFQGLYKVKFVPSYYSSSISSIAVSSKERAKKEKEKERKKKEKNKIKDLDNDKDKDNEKETIITKFFHIISQEEFWVFEYKTNKRIPWKKLRIFSSKDQYEFEQLKKEGHLENISELTKTDIFFIITYEIKISEKDSPKILIETEEKQFFLIEKVHSGKIQNYNLPLRCQFPLEPGIFLDIGEPITEGLIDIHQLLHIFFVYHRNLDGILSGTLRSLTKFQLLLVNSIQAIYQGQGVTISSKHIEIIVRQMTSKVMIIQSGDTPFLPGELISIALMVELSNSFQLLKEQRTKNVEKKNFLYKIPQYEPKLRSATSSSLTKDGFLSAAGFQETKRVLTKAAIGGTNDWLRGLKESVMTGRIIPAGSSFFNYKNYLNSVYRYKKNF